MKQNLSKQILSCAVALVMLLSLIPATAYGAVSTTQKWSGMTDGDVLVKDTITQITKGVVEHEVVANTTAGNDQKIDYMCQVEPSENIKIVACYGKDDASKWGMVSTTAQAAAYEANHPGETVVAAINADFFNMGTGEPMGALVMDGTEYHGANNRWYFAILKDGTPVIRNTPDLSDCQQAVGGMVPLVKDGQLCPENFYLGEDDYSRCTIGIMNDGTVVTSVTHGRLFPVSCGRTYKEIALMYQRQGAKDVLVLDGGGSATYAARIEGSDKLLVRNSPSDGAEREVSSSLLIVSTAEATGVFDHAALTPNNEVYTPGYEVQFTASGVDTAGFGMELPEGAVWALADDSMDMGTINAQTGLFTAGEKTGEVTVQLLLDSAVIGTTTIEIATPDKIYFDNEEVSLGFEAESDLSIVVRNKDRDINYKAGDLIWTSTTEGLGTFNGNTFVANADNSLNGNVTATSAYDENVSGTIHVIVGMLPSVVWDFEDHMDETTGDITLAKDYYVGANGILSTSNYARGGNESIDIVSIDDDEPVRFGSHALKLNYDFTDCGAVTEGACVGTSDEMAIPGAPTGLGVWVYAPKGVGVPYGSVKDANGNLISGLWLRCYCNDGNGTKCEVNFTLEPKDGLVQDGYNAETDEWTVQPGIYWEGWQYLEADLTKWSGPFSFQPGMTFRLMFVAGINMVGTQRTGELYFDNFQFVYGTNIDDVDAPVVDSIRVNDAMLENGATLKTDTLNINAYLHDVQNKYTTGIDTETVRMFVDGNNTMNNDNYQYAVEPDGSIAHLYNVKLADGMHSVTVSLRDGFGNETTETRYFLVNTGAASENTQISVIPAEDTAIIGKTVSLNICATDNDVKTSTTQLRFGNLFKDYEVEFSDNYNGTYSYSKLSDTLTVSAERKLIAMADDDNIIATVKVKVPPTLNESNLFSYTVKGGNYTTANGYYGSYSAQEATLPVGAAYQITTDTILVGREATINVLDNEGNGVANVDLYLADTDVKIGTTDENGQWKTDYFSNAAGTTWIYAKDADGLLSFQYKVNSYASAGEAEKMPYGLMFNALPDSAHGKSMTWMSNATVAPAQSIRYRVSGTEEWTTVEADAQLRTFSKGGNSAVYVNSVILSGLNSGTVYEYQIGGDESWSEIATFTTVNANSGSTNFFVLGDIQAEDTTNIERIVNKLSEGNYDFGVQTGDAVDDATAYDHWKDITDLFGTQRFGSTDIVHVLGNHEYAGDATASAAHQFFNLPTQAKAGSYYSMTYGDVYMAVVNYTGTASQLSEAMNWLKQDAAASNATWKMLLMHQPAYYTNGVGGNAEIFNAVPSVAEEAGIDVVFSGHDHSATRTNPLRGNEVDENDGIVYYICGSSGEKSYSISSQDFFDFSKIFKMATTDFTATYLTVSADMDEMTINYYDIDRGLMDTITLHSPCAKNGHQLAYDVDKGCAVCTVCGRENTTYTGEIDDANGNTYYLLGGVLQKGWKAIGEETFYFNATTGVKETVTKTTDIPTTCTERGYYILTAMPSNVTKQYQYAAAGGHEYEQQEDGAFVCTTCGYRRVELSECTITLPYTAVNYTGKARTYYPTVIAPDGTQLQGASVDFYVNYENNVNVGTANVIVTAKSGYNTNLQDFRGDYGGTVVVNFEIRPDAPTNVSATATQTTAHVTWTAPEAADAGTDMSYVVYYSADGNKWTKAGTTKDTSFDVTGLNSATAYSFRVRAIGTVDGKDYQALSYSNVATATTLGGKPIANTTVTLSFTKTTYNGNAKKPTPTVMDGTKKLVSGTDYTTTWSNNVNAGTANVTITGKGIYSGSKTVTFQITPQNLTDTGKVTNAPNAVYTPNGATTNFSVVDMNGLMLTEGKDYTISYTNNTAVGTGKATITGMGNYTGVISTTFTIVTGDVSSLNATVEAQADLTYTGSAIKPAIKISGLVEGNDYKVTYKDNTDVGTATAVVTGMGNYAGSTSVNFQIVPADVADVVITDGSVYNYTGSPIEADLQVTAANGTVLEKDRDYQIVSYKNNTEIGTAAVTIEGIGNYTGTAEHEFTIQSADMISVTPESLTIKSGDTATFTVAAEEAVGKITVTTTDDSVATVSDTEGELDHNSMEITVTAVKTGICQIEVQMTTTIDGKEIPIGRKIVEVSVKAKSVATPVLTSVTNSPGGVTVKWNAVADAENYRVFYKTANGWKNCGETTGTSKTVTGLTSGTKYTFTVRCMNSTATAYTSSFDATGMSITYVAAPAITSVANSPKGITVKWGAVNGAEKYRVFYKTANGWKSCGETTGTSKTVTGLTSGTSYTFTVRCMNSAATAYTSSFDATGMSITYVAAPAITSVANSPKGVTVKWGAVNGAENYRVFYKTANGWKNCGETTGTSMTVTGLTSGTKYTFTVRCMDSTATAYTSSFDAAGMSITYVAAPAITSVANSPKGVTVKWGAVNGAENYRVFYKTANGWKNCGETTGTNMTVTGLTSGTSYTFTVRCINSAATAYTSSFDAAGMSITYVAAPTITSVANATKGVTVKWNAVEGAGQYRVYYKTGTGSWTKFGDTTGTSLTVTGLSSGTKYSFTVRCLSADGKSFTSSYDNTGKSITYLSVPVLSSATASSTGVTVKWSKVTGASGYYVYRKTSTSGWSKIGTVSSVSTVSFKDTNATKGTTYTYTVRAYTGSTMSSFNATGVSAKR